MPTTSSWNRMLPCAKKPSKKHKKPRSKRVSRSSKYSMRPRRRRLSSKSSKKHWPNKMRFRWKKCQRLIKLKDKVAFGTITPTIGKRSLSPNGQRRLSRECLVYFITGKTDACSQSKKSRTSRAKVLFAFEKARKLWPTSIASNLFIFAPCRMRPILMSLGK